MHASYLWFSVHGRDYPELEGVCGRLDEGDDLVVRRPLHVVLVDPHDVVALLHPRALQVDKNRRQLLMLNSSQIGGIFLVISGPWFLQSTAID